MTTLEEAKQQLRQDWIEGTHCPCCGQFVKRYRRKINSSMARTLIVFAKHSGGDVRRWIHVDQEIIQPSTGHVARDFSILRFWGLIEPRPHREPGKRTSGYWRITRKGLDFALRRVSIPSHVLLYNDRCLGLDGDEIDIVAALGRKFDYEELMRS